MKTLKVQIEFDLEQAVYLKTDPDQRVRIVSCILVTASGAVLYQLSHATYTSNHYACEISETKDYSIAG